MANDNDVFLNQFQSFPLIIELIKDFQKIGTLKNMLIIIVKQQWLRFWLDFWLYRLDLKFVKKKKKYPFALIIARSSFRLEEGEEGAGRRGKRACRWKTERIVTMTTSVCMCKGMWRAHFIPNFGFTLNPNRYGPFRIRPLIGPIDTLPLSQTSDRLSQNAV